MTGGPSMTSGGEREASAAPTTSASWRMNPSSSWSRTYSPPAGIPRRARRVDYAELHCHSHFSFKEGASPAGSLLARAIKLGYKALGLRGVQAGAMRAFHDGGRCSIQTRRNAEHRGTEG